MGIITRRQIVRIFISRILLKRKLLLFSEIELWHLAFVPYVLNRHLLYKSLNLKQSKKEGDPKQNILGDLFLSQDLKILIRMQFGCKTSFFPC